jgi:FkbM family methyltransferase
MISAVWRPTRLGMRFASPLLKMRRLLRAPLQQLIRTLVANGAGLRFVNLVYRRLSPAARLRFVYLCCEPSWRVAGRWTVDFAGRRLRLPLSRDFPDAWRCAIGFHGYDLEIYALYEQLVAGPRPPRIVFDIGANYGLHALRFLIHGARVLAFEPNPECHRWFRAWCAANSVPCELQAVAVGERAGTAVLVVPEGRTYLGSTNPDVRGRWADATVRTLTVPQVALDEVVRAQGLVPDFVKIDTEGSELEVLRGAVDLLRTAQPMLLFEAWREDDTRRALWEILDKHGYAIAAVGEPRAPLTRAAFVDARATNFLAEVPPGRMIGC